MTIYTENIPTIYRKYTEMNIEIRGIDAAIKKLGDIIQVERQLQPTMHRAVQIIHDEIAEYVPKAAGAFSRLATPAQKRAYWAKVSAGEIRHGANGYIRTGHTGRAWTTKVTTSPLTGVVGNNRPAAKWVYGEKTQQPFHRESGFKTDEQVAREQRDRIVRMFERDIAKIIYR